MKKRALLLILFLITVSFGTSMTVSSEDINTADIAMATKQYGQAKDIYRQVYINSKEDSDISRALMGIARADYGLKNYYEAGINLKRFLKLYPKSPYANEAHLIMGLSLLQVRKYAEAEEHLNQVSGEFHEKANVANAELALVKNDIPGAEKLLAKLEKNTYESNYRVIYIRAMVLSRLNKHNDAIRTINSIPEPILKEENIRVSKAIIYYNAGKYIDAKEMLTAITNDPSSRIEDMQAKKTLFQVSSIENNDEATLRLALELIDYEATDDMKMKIISIYEKKGEIDNALRYLVGLRNKKVLADEIEKRLRVLVDEKNSKADEYVGKYYIYLDLDSRYNIELAKYSLDKGNKELGKRILLRALRGKVGSEAAIILGEMLVAEKRYAEAKRYLLPVTTDVHFAGQACLLLSKILEKEGDDKGAEQYRARAIRVLEVQKDYPRVGELYMRSGNKAEALKNYVRAADKGDVRSMVSAADLFYAAGKHDRARVYYKKALDKGIKDPKVEQWIDYQYGKLAKDDEYLNKAKAGGGAVAEAAELLKSSR